MERVSFVVKSVLAFNYNAEKRSFLIKHLNEDGVKIEILRSE